MAESGPRILVLAGSLRAASFNRKLARLGAGALRAAGADVTELDLREHPLPLFDQDLEEREGAPPSVLALKGLFRASQGFLVASPEYNSSITGVLKNTIDWVSRPVPGEPPLAPFKGKVAALVAASPGALGGLRGLVTIRSILGNLGVLVLPDQVALPKADTAFREDGSLVELARAAAVEKLARELVRVTAALRG